MDSEQEETREDSALPGGSFQLLVQRFGYQALINLGVLENPITGDKTVHLGHAQTVLDDLAMLERKTAGNLEPAEAEHLQSVLDELRTHFRRVAES